MAANFHTPIVLMIWILSLVIVTQTITLAVAAGKRETDFHEDRNLYRAVLACFVACIGSWGSFRVVKMSVPSTHHVSAIIASAAALFIMAAKWLPVMVAVIRRNLIYPSRYHYHCNTGSMSIGYDETVCRVIKADGVYFIVEWLLVAGLAAAMVGRARQVRDLDHTGAYAAVGVYREDLRRRNLSYFATALNFTTVVGVFIWMAAWLWLVDAREYYPVADFAAFDLLWLSFGMAVLLSVGRGSAIFTAMACAGASFVSVIDWLHRIRTQAYGTLCSVDTDTCSGIKAVAAGEGIWLFSQLLLAMLAAANHEARMRGDTHDVLFEEAKPHYATLPGGHTAVPAHPVASQ